MWRLDLAFADVIATSSDPRLGAVRLAWWRERLEALDAGGSPPAEPRLRSVARELLPRDVSGKELSQLEDCWLPLIEPFPWGDAQAHGLRRRGRLLFGIAARLLGGDPREAEAAGELWSLVDGAAHCSDEESRIFLRGEATRAVSRLPRRIPLSLRSLTIVAAIAAHEVRPSGTFGRGGAALAHRLRGTFPR